MVSIVYLVIFLIIVLSCSIKTVNQQEVLIIERFGKFQKRLDAGLNFIVPFIDKVRYKHSLKENAIDIPQQTAITSDNVTLVIDGLIYLKIVDPVAASYGAERPVYAVAQLAQTAMRSEIGKIVLDKTFEERENLNVHILQIINEAAKNWGVQCMRYEIKDINLPESVKEAMELQVAAERKKRAMILASEGEKQAQINKAEATKLESILQAEGSKQSSILKSEAQMIETVNKAKGEKEAISMVAEANAIALQKIADVIGSEAGQDASRLKIAEDYVKAFEKLAKSSNTMIIPSNSSDVSSIIAQALGTLDALKKDRK